jgi:hypothetical protein
MEHTLALASRVNHAEVPIFSVHHNDYIRNANNLPKLQNNKIWSLYIKLKA